MKVRSELDHGMHQLNEMIFRMEGLVATAMERAIESLKRQDDGPPCDP